MGDSRELFRNLQSRAFRGADLLADKLSLSRTTLSAEQLMLDARRRTGLDDFGNWSFQEPLRVLLRAYDEEANLTAFGRFAVRWDMIRFLSNLLRTRDEEKRNPGIAQTPISQPTFIMGVPRSGTTYLHNLLAKDPGNLVPQCWQTIYPYPERGRIATDDARRKMVARQFANFLRLVPDLPSLHPLEADAAQECIEITGQVIQSLRFDTTHYVPSYARWLEGAGHAEAYRFHKRFLQHLQHQKGGGRWILKSPDHIFALDALREVYRDARFVFVHRDPMRVLPSVARLTHVLRQPFTRKVDLVQIGQQVSHRWATGAQLLIDASERLKASPELVLHLQYRDLVREPFKTVTAIYKYFGWRLTDRASIRLQRAIDERPNGGYGRNHYRVKDYGLNPAAERRLYNSYITHFHITPESVAGESPSPTSEAV